MNIFKRLISPEDQNYRSKTTVFFICLVISTLLWILTKFAYQYTADIELPIQFISIPDDKVMVSKPDSLLRINVRASGFGLLRYNYFLKKKPFEINLINYRMQMPEGFSELTLGTTPLAQQIVERYNLPGQIEYVVPENIVLHFEDKQSKSVPVIPDVEYTLTKQYFAYDSLSVDPKYVKLSGTAAAIEKIYFVKTAPLKYENLTESIHQTVTILMPASKDFYEIEPKEALITLQVEKYTEAEIEVQIEQIIAPGSPRVKLFPEKVKVYYMVALKDFKRIEPSMFSCQVDLLGVKEFSGKRINVIIRDYPSYAKIVRIVPSDVEYIILK
ncbi:MAG: hypothetical protein IH598_08835 [Bacteroidales bacterium]|nr:hypothetical protein [Bacteroidales bacterium]